MNNIITKSDLAASGAGLSLPGMLTKTSWLLPNDMALDEWTRCGGALGKIEGAVQWWLGDWWAFGEHKYGERKALFAEGGPLDDMDFGTVRNYGSVARAFETSRRRDVLSFNHHAEIAPLPTDRQEYWLDKAANESLSVMKLRSLIRQGIAVEKTNNIEMNAVALGKFVVLYADPPWQYEHPPMGGSNRSIENHYPTMTIEEICALPISEIAHENSILFLWATSPKLFECMEVVHSWGFTYRTDMVWIKDKIGMGYYARQRHEALLIAVRGELPTPPPECRPDSVVEAPRLEHSAKPPVFYDLIDKMYPAVRKIELFGRAPEQREWWTTWGNQA